MLSMAIALTALAHLLALAAVLAFARFDRVLIDEAGLPLPGAGRPAGADWQEATIPLAIEAELPR